MEYQRTISRGMYKSLNLFRFSLTIHFWFSYGEILKNKEIKTYMQHLD